MRILERPLPDQPTTEEPQLKKAKSEDVSASSSIADKVDQDKYDILDDIVSDVVQSVKAHLAEIKSAQKADGAPIPRQETISKLTRFQDRVLELYRQELAYPQTSNPRTGLSDLDQENADGNVVLSAFGLIPKLKPVYSSLQRTATPDRALTALSESSLPNGVTVTRLQQAPPSSTDKNGRVLTLGDLFPSPRNLPPLQPPKATKNTTKSNVLTFYHPELTEKSKYRSNTYFSQTVTTGHWLDYSNATPTMHGKTKQRERAQSLAGVKPSSIELEMSEMEALFRGAFSSFAPSKDDSAAIVPSAQVSRMWWQRVGRLSMEKMLDAEAPDAAADDAEVPGVTQSIEVDEAAIKAAIESWDETMVDPSLDQVLGAKSDEEKEVDDLLEEVSDLIETLASYQRNRNLVLPTSQDRYSADPVNGDMLRNGSASHHPGDEEMATYQALKAQLSLIIKTLPPYAVARLNSDKLEELNVSTKIEIRTDEYRGVMEDDEPARLAKQAAQAAAGPRAVHRTPSVSSPAPFVNHQYGTPQYSGMNRQVAPPQHYPQTPIRTPAAPTMYQQRPPSAVPMQQPHQAQPRPPPQQYRPASFGGYAAQLAKHQGSHPPPAMPQYPGSPGPVQARMSPHQPGYANLPQAPQPNHRYSQGYPQGFPQHQQMHAQPMQQHAPPPQHAQHPQHVQHHAPSPGYVPYANGGQMPRTVSPQIPTAHPYAQQVQMQQIPQQHPQQLPQQHPQQQPQPQHPQQHQGLPQQHVQHVQHQQHIQHQQHNPRPPYGSPGQGVMPSPVQRHYNPPGGLPPGVNAGLTGYHTVMPEVQQRQVMEQARARMGAQQSATGHMGKVAQGEIAGLAGIGLGGPVDINKLAAQRAMQAGSGIPGSGRPPMPSPVNGGPQAPPPVPSPLSAHGSSASPVPGGGFQPPHV